MNNERDAFNSSIRGKRNNRKSRGSRNYGNNKNSTSEKFCSQRPFQTSHPNREYRKTLSSADNYRNKNYRGKFIRENYYHNNNSYRGHYDSQRFRYKRQRYSNSPRNASSISFNEREFVSSTFRDTPKIHLRVNEKKTGRMLNNKKNKDKQSSPTSDNLSKGIFVDTLPSVESKNISEDANHGHYICKSNLEFPSIKISAVSGNSIIKKSTRKRYFSQSSAPTEVSQSSRKRNASTKCFSSQVPNHKKFKEDFVGDEFEIFETTSIKERENSNSYPPTKVESKTELESDVRDFKSNANSNELDHSQSQPLTPFSIPCGQIQKNDNEIDCPTQEHRISLANFFSETNSTSLSQFFEENVKAEKSKELHSTHDNIDSLFNDMDNPLLQTISQNSQSITGPLVSPIKYCGNLFSVSSSEDKLPKNKILAENETNLSGESELIPSSQECDNTSSVLPNIESLKSFSRSMSEKNPVNIQDSTQFSGVGKKKTNLCVEESINKNEYSNLNTPYLNPDISHPLTSTQYCSRKRNLYTPQISPLIAQEPIPVTANSFIELPEHPDSSVAMCNNNKPLISTQYSPRKRNLFTPQISPFAANEKASVTANLFMELSEHQESSVAMHNNQEQSEDGGITCAKPSTQPFDGSTNETHFVKKFDNIKFKMEKLFDIPDFNSQRSVNILLESANKSVDDNPEQVVDVIKVLTDVIFDKEEKSLVPAFEKDNRSEHSEDSGKSVDEEALMLESEANHIRDKNFTENPQDNESGEDSSLSDKVTHQEPKEKVYENEDESNSIQKKKNKLYNKLSSSQKELCEEYDSKVCSVLNILKNLFEKKKKTYLNELTPTAFNIKITDREGSDVHIEKKSFSLPAFKKSGHGNPQNVVEIMVRSRSYLNYSSLNDENSFINYNDQIESNDKLIEEKNIDNEDIKKNITLKSNDKVMKEKNIDIKDSETTKKNDKNKNSKSILLQENWWENITKDLPDCVFDSPTKVIKDLHEEDNLDNANNNKRKKKKKKSEKFINDEESSEEKIYSNFTPFFFNESSEDAQTTPKENIKKRNQQHLICLNELSINSDPALSKVKKTLKKKLKCIKSSQKTLTPPFEFKKIKTKPGQKRILLNNRESEYY